MTGIKEYNVLLLLTSRRDFIPQVMSFFRLDQQKNLPPPSKPQRSPH